MEAKAQSRRRLEWQCRKATFVATVEALSVAAVDDAADLFYALMASKVLGSSKRPAGAARLETLTKLEKGSAVLARAGRELAACLLEEAG